jgi:dolichyl-phosphate-mannose-protein mannosyltransferase
MEKIIRLLARFARWEHFGLLVLVLASLTLHIAIISQPADPMFDEAHYVTDARRILSGSGTERVEHPPVGKLGVAAGIRVFGDNPWGWRMPSVILGTVELILFYGICRRMGAKPRVTYIATFLFSLENLTFIHTGTAMLDIYLAFFMMLAFWLYLKGLSIKHRLFNVWWLFMAIAIALSALSKLNGVFVAIPIGLHWLLAGYKRPEAAPSATTPAPEPVALSITEPETLPVIEPPPSLLLLCPPERLGKRPLTSLSQKSWR